MYSRQFENSYAKPVEAPQLTNTTQSSSWAKLVAGHFKSRMRPKDI